MPINPWTLTPQQVIDSPEISILVFHNVYPEGKQGGLEIIQHGERIATNGDLRLEPAPGQWAPLPQAQNRSASEAETRVSVQMAFAQPAIQYAVRVWTDGEAVELAVDLAQPLADEWAGKVGFNLELLPSAFFGKAYYMDSVGGTFPRQNPENPGLINGKIDKVWKHFGGLQRLTHAGRKDR
jgi:endoglucanase